VVRFSDMLGSNDDAEPAPAPASAPPLAEIADEIPEPDAEPEPEPVDMDADADADAPEPAANASPEEVLDRLTQYAAGHVPVPEAPSAAPPTAPSLDPVGDDLLPRGKRRRRS
jgi:hypothetical protein